MEIFSSSPSALGAGAVGDESFCPHTSKEEDQGTLNDLGQATSSENSFSLSSRRDAATSGDVVADFYASLTAQAALPALQVPGRRLLRCTYIETNRRASDGGGCPGSSEPGITRTSVFRASPTYTSSGGGRPSEIARGMYTPGGGSSGDSRCTDSAGNGGLESNKYTLEQGRHAGRGSVQYSREALPSPIGSPQGSLSISYMHSYVSSERGSHLSNSVSAASGGDGDGRGGLHSRGEDKEPSQEGCPYMPGGRNSCDGCGYARDKKKRGDFYGASKGRDRSGRRGRNRTRRHSEQGGFFRKIQQQDRFSGRAAATSGGTSFIPFPTTAAENIGFFSPSTWPAFSSPPSSSQFSSSSFSNSSNMSSREQPAQSFLSHTTASLPTSPPSLPSTAFSPFHPSGGFFSPSPLVTKENATGRDTFMSPVSSRDAPPGDRNDTSEDPEEHQVVKKQERQDETKKTRLQSERLTRQLAEGTGFGGEHPAVVRSSFSHPPPEGEGQGKASQKSHLNKPDLCEPRGGQTDKLDSVCTATPQGGGSTTQSHTKLSNTGLRSETKQRADSLHVEKKDKTGKKRAPHGKLPLEERDPWQVVPQETLAVPSLPDELSFKSPPERSALGNKQATGTAPCRSDIGLRSPAAGRMPDPERAKTSILWQRAKEKGLLASPENQSRPGAEPSGGHRQGERSRNRHFRLAVKDPWQAGEDSETGGLAGETGMCLRGGPGFVDTTELTRHSLCQQERRKSSGDVAPPLGGERRSIHHRKDAPSATGQHGRLDSNLFPSRENGNKANDWDRKEKRLSNDFSVLSSRNAWQGDVQREKNAAKIEQSSPRWGMTVREGQHAEKARKARSCNSVSQAGRKSRLSGATSPGSLQDPSFRHFAASMSPPSYSPSPGVSSCFFFSTSSSSSQGVCASSTVRVPHSPTSSCGCPSSSAGLSSSPCDPWGSTSAAPPECLAASATLASSSPTPVTSTACSSTSAAGVSTPVSPVPLSSPPFSASSFCTPPLPQVCGFSPFSASSLPFSSVGSLPSSSPLFPGRFSSPSSETLPVSVTSLPALSCSSPSVLSSVSSPAIGGAGNSSSVQSSSSATFASAAQSRACRVDRSSPPTSAFVSALSSSSSLSTSSASSSVSCTMSLSAPSASHSGASPTPSLLQSAQSMPQAGSFSAEEARGLAGISGSVGMTTENQQSHSQHRNGKQRRSSSKRSSDGGAVKERDSRKESGSHFPCSFASSASLSGAASSSSFSSTPATDVQGSSTVQLLKDCSSSSPIEVSGAADVSLTRRDFSSRGLSKRGHYPVCQGTSTSVSPESPASSVEIQYASSSTSVSCSSSSSSANWSPENRQPPGAFQRARPGSSSLQSSSPDGPVVPTVSQSSSSSVVTEVLSSQSPSDPSACTLPPGAFGPSGQASPSVRLPRKEAALAVYSSMTPAPTTSSGEKQKETSRVLSRSSQEKVNLMSRELPRKKPGSAQGDDASQGKRRAENALEARGELESSPFRRRSRSPVSREPTPRGSSGFLRKANRHFRLPFKAEGHSLSSEEEGEWGRTTGASSPLEEGEIVETPVKIRMAVRCEPGRERVSGSRGGTKELRGEDPGRDRVSVTSPVSLRKEPKNRHGSEEARKREDDIRHSRGNHRRDAKEKGRAEHRSRRQESKRKDEKRRNKERRHSREEKKCREEKDHRRGRDRKKEEREKREDKPSRSPGPGEDAYTRRETREKRRSRSNEKKKKKKDDRRRSRERGRDEEYADRKDQRAKKKKTEKRKKTSDRSSGEHRRIHKDRHAKKDRKERKRSLSRRSLDKPTIPQLKSSPSSVPSSSSLSSSSSPTSSSSTVSSSSPSSLSFASPLSSSRFRVSPSAVPSPAASSTSSSSLVSSSLVRDSSSPRPARVSHSYVSPSSSSSPSRGPKLVTSSALPCSHSPSIVTSGCPIPDSSASKNTPSSCSTSNNSSYPLLSTLRSHVATSPAKLPEVASPCSSSSSHLRTSFCSSLEVKQLEPLSPSSLSSCSVAASSPSPLSPSPSASPRKTLSKSDKEHAPPKVLPFDAAADVLPRRPPSFFSLAASPRRLSRPESSLREFVSPFSTSCARELPSGREERHSPEDYSSLSSLSSPAHTYSVESTTPASAVFVSPPVCSFPETTVEGSTIPSVREKSACIGSSDGEQHSGEGQRRLRKDNDVSETGKKATHQLQDEISRRFLSFPSSDSPCPPTCSGVHMASSSSYSSSSTIASSASSLPLVSRAFPLSSSPCAFTKIACRPQTSTLEERTGALPSGAEGLPAVSVSSSPSCSVLVQCEETRRERQEKVVKGQGISEQKKAVDRSTIWRTHETDGTCKKRADSPLEGGSQKGGRAVEDTATKSTEKMRDSGEKVFHVHPALGKETPTREVTEEKRSTKESTREQVSRSQAGEEVGEQETSGSRDERFVSMEKSKTSSSGKSTEKQQRSCKDRPTLPEEKGEVLRRYRHEGNEESNLVYTEKGKGEEKGQRMREKTNAEDSDGENNAVKKEASIPLSTNSGTGRMSAPREATAVGDSAAFFSPVSEMSHTVHRQGMEKKIEASKPRVSSLTVTEITREKTVKEPSEEENKRATPSEFSSSDDSEISEPSPLCTSRKRSQETSEESRRKEKEEKRPFGSTQESPLLSPFSHLSMPPGTRREINETLPIFSPPLVVSKLGLLSSPGSPPQGSSGLFSCPQGTPSSFSSVSLPDTESPELSQKARNEFPSPFTDRRVFETKVSSCSKSPMNRKEKLERTIATCSEIDGSLHPASSAAAEARATLFALSPCPQEPPTSSSPSLSQEASPAFPSEVPIKKATRCSSSPLSHEGLAANGRDWIEKEIARWVGEQKERSDVLGQKKKKRKPRGPCHSDNLRSRSSSLQRPLTVTGDPVTPDVEVSSSASSASSEVTPSCFPDNQPESTKKNNIAEASSAIPEAASQSQSQMNERSIPVAVVSSCSQGQKNAARPCVEKHLARHESRDSFKDQQASSPRGDTSLEEGTSVSSQSCHRQAVRMESMASSIERRRTISSSPLSRPSDIIPPTPDELLRSGGKPTEEISSSSGVTKNAALEGSYSLSAETAACSTTAICPSMKADTPSTEHPPTDSSLSRDFKRNESPVLGSSEEITPQSGSAFSSTTRVFVGSTEEGKSGGGRHEGIGHVPKVKPSAKAAAAAAVAALRRSRSRSCTTPGSCKSSSLTTLSPLDHMSPSSPGYLPEKRDLNNKEDTTKKKEGQDQEATLCLAGNESGPMKEFRSKASSADVNGEARGAGGEVQLKSNVRMDSFRKDNETDMHDSKSSSRRMAENRPEEIGKRKQVDEISIHPGEPLSTMATEERGRGDNYAGERRESGDNERREEKNLTADTKVHEDETAERGRNVDKLFEEERKAREMKAKVVRTGEEVQEKGLRHTSEREHEESVAQDITDEKQKGTQHLQECVRIETLGQQQEKEEQKREGEDEKAKKERESQLANERQQPGLMDSKGHGECTRQGEEASEVTSLQCDRVTDLSEPPESPDHHHCLGEGKEPNTSTIEQGVKWSLRTRSRASKVQSSEDKGAKGQEGEVLDVALDKGEAGQRREPYTQRIIETRRAKKKKTPEESHDTHTRPASADGNEGKTRDITGVSNEGEKIDRHHDDDEVSPDEAFRSSALQLKQRDERRGVSESDLQVSGEEKKQEGLDVDQAEASTERRRAKSSKKTRSARKRETKTREDNQREKDNSEEEENSCLFEGGLEEEKKNSTPVSNDDPSSALDIRQLRSRRLPRTTTTEGTHEESERDQKRKKQQPSCCGVSSVQTPGKDSSTNVAGGDLQSLHDTTGTEGGGLEVDVSSLQRESSSVGTAKARRDKEPTPSHSTGKKQMKEITSVSPSSQILLSPVSKPPLLPSENNDLEVVLIQEQEGEEGEKANGESGLLVSVDALTSREGEKEAKRSKDGGRLVDDREQHHTPECPRQPENAKEEEEPKQSATSSPSFSRLPLRFTQEGRGTPKSQHEDKGEEQAATRSLPCSLIGSREEDVKPAQARTSLVQSVDQGKGEEVKENEDGVGLSEGSDLEKLIQNSDEGEEEMLEEEDEERELAMEHCLEANDDSQRKDSSYGSPRWNAEWWDHVGWIEVSREDRLGRGTFGDVFQARWRSDMQPLTCCVKCTNSNNNRVEEPGGQESCQGEASHSSRGDEHGREGEEETTTNATTAGGVEEASERQVLNRCTKFLSSTNRTRVSLSGLAASTFASFPECSWCLDNRSQMVCLAVKEYKAQLSAPFQFLREEAFMRHFNAHVIRPLATRSCKEVRNSLVLHTKAPAPPLKEKEGAAKQQEDVSEMRREKKNSKNEPVGNEVEGREGSPADKKDPSNGEDGGLVAKKESSGTGGSQRNIGFSRRKEEIARLSSKEGQSVPRGREEKPHEVQRSGEALRKFQLLMPRAQGDLTRMLKRLVLRRAKLKLLLAWEEERLSLEAAGQRNFSTGLAMPEQTERKTVHEEAKEKKKNTVSDESGSKEEEKKTTKEGEQGDGTSLVKSVDASGKQATPAVALTTTTTTTAGLSLASLSSSSNTSSDSLTSSSSSLSSSRKGWGSWGAPGLTEFEVKFLMAQLLSGGAFLQCCCEADIARIVDVKPSNVLVFCRPQDIYSPLRWLLCLADFGSSLVLHPTEHLSASTPWAAGLDEKRRCWRVQVQKQLATYNQGTTYTNAPEALRFDRFGRLRDPSGPILASLISSPSGDGLLQGGEASHRKRLIVSARGKERSSPDGVNASASWSRGNSSGGVRLQQGTGERGTWLLSGGGRCRRRIEGDGEEAYSFERRDRKLLMPSFGVSSRDEERKKRLRGENSVSDLERKNGKIVRTSPLPMSSVGDHKHLGHHENSTGNQRVDGRVCVQSVQTTTGVGGSSRAEGSKVCGEETGEEERKKRRILVEASRGEIGRDERLIGGDAKEDMLFSSSFSVSKDVGYGLSHNSNDKDLNLQRSTPHIASTRLHLNSSSGAGNEKGNSSLHQMCLLSSQSGKSYSLSSRAGGIGGAGNTHSNTSGQSNSGSSSTVSISSITTVSSGTRQKEKEWLRQLKKHQMLGIVGLCNQNSLEKNTATVSSTGRLGGGSAGQGIARKGREEQGENFLGRLVSKVHAKRRLVERELEGERRDKGTSSVLTKRGGESAVVEKETAGGMLEKGDHEEEEHKKTEGSKTDGSSKEKGTTSHLTENLRGGEKERNQEREIEGRKCHTISPRGGSGKNPPGRPERRSTILAEGEEVTKETRGLRQVLSGPRGSGCTSTGGEQKRKEATPVQHLPITKHSDAWSFGVTLGELAKGGGCCCCPAFRRWQKLRDGFHEGEGEDEQDEGQCTCMTPLTSELFEKAEKKARVILRRMRTQKLAERDSVNLPLSSSRMPLDSPASLPSTGERRGIGNGWATKAGSGGHDGNGMKRRDKEKNEENKTEDQKEECNHNTAMRTDTSKDREAFVLSSIWGTLPRQYGTYWRAAKEVVISIGHGLFRLKGEEEQKKLREKARASAMRWCGRPAEALDEEETRQLHKLAWNWVIAMQTAWLCDCPDSQRVSRLRQHSALAYPYSSSFSPSFWSLLSSLLAYSASERLLPAEALGHTWFSVSQTRTATTSPMELFTLIDSLPGFQELHLPAEHRTDRNKRLRYNAPPTGPSGLAGGIPVLGSLRGKANSRVAKQPCQQHLPSSAISSPITTAVPSCTSAGSMTTTSVSSSVLPDTDLKKTKDTFSHTRKDKSSLLATSSRYSSSPLYGGYGCVARRPHAWYTGALHGVSPSHSASLVASLLSSNRSLSSESKHNGNPGLDAGNRHGVKGLILTSNSNNLSASDTLSRSGIKEKDDNMKGIVITRKHQDEEGDAHRSAKNAAVVIARDEREESNDDRGGERIPNEGEEGRSDAQGSSKDRGEERTNVETHMGESGEQGSLNDLMITYGGEQDEHNKENDSNGNSHHLLRPNQKMKKQDSFSYNGNGETAKTKLTQMSSCQIDTKASCLIDTPMGDPEGTRDAKEKEEAEEKENCRKMALEKNLKNISLFYLAPWQVAGCSADEFVQAVCTQEAHVLSKNERLLWGRTGLVLKTLLSLKQKHSWSWEEVCSSYAAHKLGEKLLQMHDEKMKKLSKSSLGGGSLVTSSLSSSLPFIDKTISNRRHAQQQEEEEKEMQAQ
ncbi:hypothetical protein CSUI_004398 [Cystoisospora suis]|uniref:Uncharacterized protein n=1 Tax=Cystoisospora suis TaxID=483139 RepID=A0A2C6L1N5_9APIC|nr:hypothetical protein CSUI_004398 [Cystoisospora suis]